MLRLKLDKAEHFGEGKNAWQQALVAQIFFGDIYAAKLTTNKLEIRFDKKDANTPVCFYKVKLILETNDGDYLELGGNFGCSFVNPYGASFYLTRIGRVKGKTLKEVRGVPLTRPIRVR